MMAVALIVVAVYSVWVGMVVVQYHSIEVEPWQEQQRR